MRRFKDGQIRVLISTSVASRGLNLPVVEHVIQFDMPTTPNDFDSCVYRLGRAAADGQPLRSCPADLLRPDLHPAAGPHRAIPGPDAGPAHEYGIILSQRIRAAQRGPEER